MTLGAKWVAPARPVRYSLSMREVATARGVDARPWLISPRADLPVLVLVTVFALVPWFLAERLGWHWRWIAVAVGVFNGPHLISTLTRVYFRSGERWRRPFHYWVVPGALIAFVWICRATDGPWGNILVRSTLFYWASWHFVAQAFGILRLYQRKHHVALDSRLARLEKAMMFLPALFFVLRRVCTGPWELFGTYLLHPSVPPWLVNVVGALTVATALVFLVATLRAPTVGRGLRALFIAGNAFGFFVPFMLLKTGTTAFASAALWHAIQYVGIVWLYNRKQLGGRDIEGSGDWLDRALTWLSQPGRGPLYLASMMVPAIFAYVGFKLVLPHYHFSLESVVLALWTGGTLAHYWLDGVIWKTRRYGEVARLG
jgi:hypothetical protein